MPGPPSCRHSTREDFIRLAGGLGARRSRRQGLNDLHSRREWALGKLKSHGMTHRIQLDDDDSQVQRLEKPCARELYKHFDPFFFRVPQRHLSHGIQQDCRERGARGLQALLFAACRHDVSTSKDLFKCSEPTSEPGCLRRSTGFRPKMEQHGPKWLERCFFFFFFFLLLSSEEV